ncbi:MAG TPA: CHAT domain-containing protein [Thermoanaerobaculia bacterium]|nr:CHAT domain-containing protein [Thermoanaerobaculia bacterium]
MAAFVEGTLPPEEIAAVAAHLGECSECRTIVSETEREEAETQGSSKRMLWLATAAVLAGILIATLLVLRTSPAESLIAAAPRDHRLVAARLAGFPWAPLRPPSRGQAAPDAGDLKLSGAAGGVLDETRDGDDAASHHASGIAYLLIGSTAESIARLEQAASGSNDWRTWNDLAAARHVRALRDHRDQQLVRALEDVGEALRIEPKAAEAHFNRALILEDLGLWKRAREAWQHYSAIDGASTWGNEAREHLRRLAKTSARFDRKLFETTPIADVARRFPQESRREGEGPMLAAWADAAARGDGAEASSALARVRELGNALVELSGERLLAAAVAAIDGAGQDGTLVHAHRTYRDARIAYSRRRASDAERQFRRAATLFARAGSPMEGVARYYAASASYDQSRGEEARRELEELLVRVDASRHRALAAQIQWQIAVCANTAGDWGAAVRHADAAAATFRALGERGHAAYLDGIAAMAVELIGEPDLAWQRRRRTFAELSDLGDETRLATILHSSAMTLAALGRTAAASLLIELMAGSGAAGDEGVDATQLAYAYANSARYAARGGDMMRARRALADARSYSTQIADGALREKIEAQIALAEATLRNAETPRSDATALDASIRYFTNAKSNIDLPDAFLQRARARRAAGDEDGADSDYAAALHEVEQQRATIGDAEARLRFLNVAAQIIEETIDLRSARGDVRGAFTVAERARALLDGHGAVPPGTVQPPDARTAIVEYVVLPKSIVAFCITRNGMTAVRIAVDRRELETRIAAFAERLRRRVAEPGLRTESAALFRLLVTPLQARLAGIEELVLVPDRQLHALPFAALWDAAQDRYLSETFVLRFAPSASFRRELPPAIVAPEGSALVIADPPTPQWPLLPASRDEAASIVSLHGGTLLAGEAATRKAFLDAAPKQSLIHFAGHANSDATTSYAALLFAPASSDPGILGSGEIARLRLARYPLVVLAACGTFRGDATHVAGMSSLSLAFLVAGARGVVGTLWEIDDDVSAAVFLRFHEHLRSGITPARALRAAQLDCRRSGDPRMVHPATWAPVQLLTDV